MGLRLPGWLGFEVRKKLERLGETLQRLSVRRRINESRKLIIGVACVSVSLLVVIAVVYLRPPKVRRMGPSDREWYYDLNTQKLFVAARGLTPPIEAPSGPLPNGKPAGVKAYVLTYASDPNEADCFIGFLETVDPDAKNDATVGGNSDADGGRRWEQGRLIRMVEDLAWVPADSSEGRAIVEVAFIPNENGERPYYVRPDQGIKN